MESYARCQGFDTGFNVKFAKKYCPGGENTGQYHDTKKLLMVYHNAKQQENGEYRDRRIILLEINKRKYYSVYTL